MMVPPTDLDEGSPAEIAIGRVHSILSEFADQVATYAEITAAYGLVFGPDASKLLHIIETNLDRARAVLAAVAPASRPDRPHVLH
ncbi:hypothetical protein [Methylobacterium sp. WSM2598]|uniref:hypothetical protein n=1 Tax=Methylobacterium sp. WSM2598 TaxID=398261 RepID=UPI0003738C4A|nr:hypothetical protein [Methylobacterium sp. WSM2598]